MTDLVRPAEFDTYSGSYDDAVNASVAFSGLKVDFFTRVKAGYIRDIVAGTFADQADIDMLDIGCGVGNYHPYLSGAARSIAGVDISAACIATAKRRNPDVLYQTYEGDRLPFADASFDVAYTICVMHHVPPARWARFASEMRRILRPRGLALVFEHNPYNPVTRRAVSTCVFDRDAVLLRARATRALLCGAGFENVRSGSILSIPAATPLLRKVDRLFAKLPFGAQYVAQGHVPSP